MLGRNTHWKGSSNICHQRIQPCAVRTYTAFWENGGLLRNTDTASVPRTPTLPIQHRIHCPGGEEFHFLLLCLLLWVERSGIIVWFWITALQHGVALGPFSSPCRWGQLDPVTQQMSPSRIIQAGVLNSFPITLRPCTLANPRWGFLFLWPGIGMCVCVWLLTGFVL